MASSAGARPRDGDAMAANGEPAAGAGVGGDCGMPGGVAISLPAAGGRGRGAGGAEIGDGAAGDIGGATLLV